VRLTAIRVSPMRPLPDDKLNPGPGAPFAADAELEGTAFPNLLFEVAFGESLPHVQTQVVTWLSGLTDVQQVIVLKIGDTALAHGGRALVAYSYLRGMANPVQTIDFSYPAHQVMAAGTPDMQLHVPLASLFFGVPGGAPAELPNAMMIDLCWLQRRVMLTPGF
jgi:hypothetical protein